MAPWNRISAAEVRHDHQAMRAAAGSGFIVVLRDQFGDGLGEFVAESGPVRCRPEANLGIHRQGRQAFARLVGATNKVAHLADDPCAQGDEIAGGQPIDFPFRIRGDGTQGAWRNDVGSGRRHEQPFRQPAPLAFLGQPHQAVRLQRVQMIVDFLTSQADPRGQRRRRGGRGQLERSRLRMGSKATVAAAGSSMTWISSMKEDGSIDNYSCQA